MCACNNCYGCKHFDAGDSSHGGSNEVFCDYASKLHDAGECTEQVSIAFGAILFALSDLRHCPFYEKPRRSILSSVRKATQAEESE